MKKTPFIIETYNEYITRILKSLRDNELTSVKISTMNLYAEEKTLMHDFLSAMTAAHQQSPDNFLIYYDEVYMRRMLVMPDGHYIFRHSPWDLGKGKFKISARQVHDKNLQEFADVLVNLPPRFYQMTTQANFWKKLVSRPLLQHLATSHVKAGLVRRKNGHFETAIQTGELSSASTQNNLSLSLPDNEPAAKFVETVINPKTKIGDRGFAIKRIAPHIKLIADYGNHGRPGQISHVHELAEIMINPQKHHPTNVILVSQYVPSGRILKSLKLAADPKHHNARVVVPLEPANDYRRSEIGFKIMDKNFELRRGKYILTPARPVSSHTKCLIVKYDDDTLAMIFGSDNFDSTSDGFYRNTELSLHVDRVKKSENGYDMIISMLKKLVAEKEINQSEYKKFTAKPL